MYKCVQSERVRLRFPGSFSKKNINQYHCGNPNSLSSTAPWRFLDRALIDQVAHAQGRLCLKMLVAERQVDSGMNGKCALQSMDSFRFAPDSRSCLTWLILVSLSRYNVHLNLITPTKGETFVSTLRLALPVYCA